MQNAKDWSGVRNRFAESLSKKRRNFSVLVKARHCFQIGNSRQVAQASRKVKPIFWNGLLNAADVDCPVRVNKVPAFCDQSAPIIPLRGGGTSDLHHIFVFFASRRRFRRVFRRGPFRGAFWPWGRLLCGWRCKTPWVVKEALPKPGSTAGPVKHTRKIVCERGFPRLASFIHRPPRTAGI